jgi:phosphohistidine swiveling domain-containing protein
VRSSALDEDGHARSFAGQHDTVLGAEGLEAVEAAVRRCWSSAYSTRARAYRAAAAGPSDGAARMAVVVQKLVQARAAGVVFTRDPSSRGDRLIIEAVPGLGEALVSGKAAPERFIVERATRAARRDDASGARALSEAQVAELAREALELEARLGEPQDLEWAYDDSGLWWLQARPITAGAGSTPRPEEDERLVWSNTNVGELLPDVATPMTFAIAEIWIRRMFGDLVGMLGLDLTGVPIAGRIGGRIYACMNVYQALMRVVPGMGSRSPAELFGGQGEAIAAALERAADRERPLIRVSRMRFLAGLPRFIAELWRQREVDPAEAMRQLQASTRALAAVELERLSDEQLFAYQDEALALDAGASRDMVSAMIVGGGCVDGMRRACASWLGDGDGAIAATLLSGMGALDSAESALELWALGDQLRSRSLEEAVAEGRWAQVHSRLEATANGREFLKAWDDWMARHGHHARAELDVAQPRWREEPDHVLETLRAWLQSEGARSPQDAYAQTVASRERLERDCSARLGWLRRRVFRALLTRAQRGLRLRENWKSESVRRLALTRAALLELGRRLACAGALEAPGDVFFLSLIEARAAVADPRSGRWRAAASQARGEYDQWLPLTPPPVVVGRLNPADAVPATVPDAPVLKGLAVSAGLVEGAARVVLRSDQESRLVPGEILVAPFTDPGWAPYFVAAKGLVVDMGGMLSHGSIIAREYGIPAVVNVGCGTRRIRTGAQLRVDGFRGEVTILSEPGEGADSSSLGVGE